MDTGPKTKLYGHRTHGHKTKIWTQDKDLWTHDIWTKDTWTQDRRKSGKKYGHRTLGPKTIIFQDNKFYTRLNVHDTGLLHLGKN